MASKSAADQSSILKPVLILVGALLFAWVITGAFAAMQWSNAQQAATRITELENDLQQLQTQYGVNGGDEGQ